MNFVLVGAELAQGKDFPETMTQQKFTDAHQSIPATQKLRASRKRLSKVGDIRRRRRKLGDSFWLATVSRPGTCPRVAQLAPKVNSLRTTLVRRANDLIKRRKTGNRPRFSNTNLGHTLALKPWQAGRIQLLDTDWVISLALSPRPPSALATFRSDHRNVRTRR